MENGNPARSRLCFEPTQPTEVRLQHGILPGLTLLLGAALAVACGGDSSGGPDAGPPAVCSATVASPSCSPPGTPNLVAGGMVGPSAAPSVCQKPHSTPSVRQSSGLVQPLGTHKVGDVVSFNVPAGSGSLSIISQAINATDTITYKGRPLDNSVVPTTLLKPDGTLIYDDNVVPDAGMEETATVFYAASSPVTGVLTVPNATPLLSSTCVAGGLPSGSWSVTVNDFAYECFLTNDPNCTGGNNTNTYDLSVLTRSGPTLATGTIDVAFYLVGAGGLTSAGAVVDPHVKRMVQTLSSIYASAGICLGAVTFYDVPAWAQSRYANGIDASDETPCGKLDQMFTLSQPGNTINFFLVGQISSTPGGGGSVVGIDGTIPGPSGVGGTVHSGAAVSAADLSAGVCPVSGGLDLGGCGADRVAYIAAHEGGHWMGLYHPTEADGESFDPLRDTPGCSCEACAPPGERSNCATPGKTRPANPAFVFPPSCTSQSGGCGGGDELMFWQLDGSVAKGKLSAEQGQVMRSNLLVH